MWAIKTTFAVVVLVSSAAGCASSTPADGGQGHRGPCAASALVLRPGTPVSPMTGEHAVSYALANRGQVACTVRGYPRITLSTRAARRCRSDMPTVAAPMSPPAGR